MAKSNITVLAFSFITFGLRLGLDVSVFVFINLSEMILASNSRANEIQADSFAFEIGYGRELISAMYLFQKITMNTNLSLSEELKASHPHTADRIAHLERLKNQLIEE